MAPWEDISPAAVWRRIVSTFKHAYVISIPISVNCRYARRRTFWTDAEVWRNAHGGFSLVHPIFSLPATSIFNVRPDAMHVLDIGIALHVLGNVFFLCCHTATYFPGPRSPHGRCELLWGRSTHIILLMDLTRQEKWCNEI